MPLINRSLRLKKMKAVAVVAIVAVGACVIASVFDGYILLFLSEEDGGSNTQSLRRGLLASNEQQIAWDGHRLTQLEDEIDLFEQEVDMDTIGGEESVPFLFPWAQANLRPNTRTVEPTLETILFWHIPKVSTAESRRISIHTQTNTTCFNRVHIERRVHCQVHLQMLR
jgi:hypothetical protein